jgi:arylsulfatase A-like enzyme
MKAWITLALAAGLATLDAAGGEMPHVVLVLADDLGYGDVGAYNTASRIPTPNLDSLASRGLRFSDAHAAGSTCVPSRYGLLTGRNPLRADLDWKSGPVIEAGRVTIASFLAQAGYATAMVGKWHQGLGPLANELEFDYTQALNGGPLDRGFDTFFGMHASLDIPPYFFIRGRMPTRAPTVPIDAGSSVGHEDGWNRIQGAFWRAGFRGEDFHLDQVTPRLAAEARRVLAGHAETRAGQPLFLYLALPSPHTPWLPAARFRGNSGAGMYGDFVMQVDAVIGELVHVLESTGMASNTLFIFSSDNGPVWYGENTRRFGHASAGGLRGMKGDGWEGGHRVPLIVSWPGRVAAAAENDQLVSLTDLMATLADVAGVPLPPGAGPDSISFYHAMTGTAGGAARTRLLHGRRVIRDGRWKLMRYLGSGGFTPPRFVEPEAGSGINGQLYDLANDVGETNNLYAEHPEIVARLGAVLDSMLRDTD